ncbi:hypothetical protein ACIHJG_37435 [Streptomyces sp. NPDC052415]|uniref:hypothetical protein n=1 Tax=Streptomyces sp. NPDC052415 TaxID=3365690 RepID=UPI0037D937F8
MLALAVSCVGGLGVTSRLRDLVDRQCVLPGDASWLHEVRYLEEDVLRIIAAAAGASAERFDEDRFVLSAGTFEGAAAVIGRLVDDMAASANGVEAAIMVLLLPAWELDYLWQVLTVFRRAQAGEPETADLRELLDDLADGLDGTVMQITEDLQRVVAVLMLDIPAVRTLAAAAARTLGLPSGLDRPLPDMADVRKAMEQVQAAWAAAGACRSAYRVGSARPRLSRRRGTTASTSTNAANTARHPPASKVDDTRKAKPGIAPVHGREQHVQQPCDPVGHTRYAWLRLPAPLEAGR